jgi:hypothetical protein
LLTDYGLSSKSLDLHQIVPPVDLILSWAQYKSL